MVNSYVFFVETGKEETVCKSLNNYFKTDQVTAYIPKVEKLFVNSRFHRVERKLMLPGTVFLDSLMDEQIFITKSYEFLRLSEYTLKLMAKEDVERLKLGKDERDLLFRLFNEEYVVEKSAGFIVGSETTVTSGPLQGYEHLIKKINRHKRQAEIEIKFLNSIKRLSVCLEIVSRE
jgi:transcriptional antiterminator NusG